ARSPLFPRARGRAAGGERASRRERRRAPDRGWRAPGRLARAAVDAGERRHGAVCNGNGGDRSLRAGLARGLASAGHRVLLFDYRGYGGNAGTPTETGLRADARAALAYLRSRPDIDPARIVYFGESLGAAVAAQLAAE